MMNEIAYKFVENIPDSIEEKTLYISLRYKTAIHKCYCGCGNEVITPLSPTDWKLIFNGKTVSLYPSIGNWNFKCQSHYWIKKNKVIWAKKWSKEQIDAGRKYDKVIKDTYYSTVNSQINPPKNELSKKKKTSFWEELKKLFFSS